MDNVLVNFQSGLDKVDEAIKQQYADDGTGKPHYDDIPGIFSLMDPMPGAKEAVDKLKDAYDVYILSTAPWGNPSAWTDKVTWLKQYFGDLFKKRVFLTHHKDFVKGDILIDDNSKNGACDFQGEWIQFGTEPFQDWFSVVTYLLNQQKCETCPLQEKSKDDTWKKIKKVLLSSRTVSCIVLVLLLIGEFFAFQWTQSLWFGCMPWVLGGIGIVFVLLILAKWIREHFIIRSVILTKLLSNAIVPTTLGTFYLLIFVIHIGWLTNVAMSMFMPAEKLNDLLFNVGICIVGLIVLTIFFPYAQDQKVEKPVKVFVSGISALYNLPKKYQDLNIRPFVRILQLAGNTDDCEMLVLQTKEFTDNDKAQRDNMYEALSSLVWKKDGDTEEEKPKIAKEYFKKLSLNEQIRIYIKEVARREFPEKHECIDKLKISFTEPCDYNVFQSCFTALNSVLKEKDDSNHQLIFNLTPGTALVSAVISLHAIDGDRQLYYYSQDRRSSLKDEEKLMPADKKQIPLRNILSQALEKIETQDK